MSTPGSHPLQSAFDAWAEATQRRRAIVRSGTVATYQDLWNLLLRWCLAQTPPRTLQKLSVDDLQQLLDSRAAASATGEELSPRYVWRLLHLIDRVQQHQALLHQQPANRSAHTLLMGREDWRHANASARDPLPEHLDAAQARQLVRHLSAARGGAQASLLPATWQDLRNRTAVALQLGAGLTPGEVRALTLSAIVQRTVRRQALPWKLLLPAQAQSPAHETPMAPWAARLLQQWLAQRAALGIPGVQVLPSTRTGKPWGKVAHYNAVTQVLQAAGLGPAGDGAGQGGQGGGATGGGGSFRLRHTFALRQLQRGRSAEEVARWLGVVDPAVLERYQRVVFDPEDSGVV